MQSETKIFVTNIYRRRGCEGGALFVKQNKRGPESEWNLQSKLASGPIAVVNWPSLPLKIVSLVVKISFEMCVMVEVRYTPRFRLLWHL